MNKNNNNLYQCMSVLNCLARFFHSLFCSFKSYLRIDCSSIFLFFMRCLSSLPMVSFYCLYMQKQGPFTFLASCVLCHLLCVPFCAPLLSALKGLCLCTPSFAVLLCFCSLFLYSPRFMFMAPFICQY